MSEKNSPSTQTLWRQFLRLSQQMTRTGAGIIQMHGITPPQFLVMMHLCDGEDAPTQKDLADALLVTEGNVSQMLKIMERKGWIVRDQCELGKRILLTDEAQHLYAQVEADHNAFIQHVYGDLSADDRTSMARMMTQLQQTLDLDIERGHDGANFT